MTGVSMPCCEATLTGRLWHALAWLACMAFVAPALAHKGSDAYLQLKLDEAAAGLRVDVALRDLDPVLDIDADGNGQLTWGEVKAAHPSIERYLAARVQVDGCRWPSAATHALERRADGVYAALSWSGTCAQAAALPLIRYSALREIDPTHRAVAKIERPGSDAVVRVLDPTQRLAPAVAAEAPEARSAASAVATAEPFAAGPVDGEPVDVAAARGSIPAIATTPDAEATAAHAAQHALGGFITEGMRHILGGYDHVLFLICLLLPAVMRRTATGWQPVERLSQAIVPVAIIVTSFTVAHSVTLALAALKVLAVPSSVIEPAIAVTIMLTALDNVRPIFGGHRAIVTFLFGLIHGFGFAGVLGELDLPTVQFAWALFQFNLGIELGQLFIVVVAISGLFLLRQQRGYPRWVIQGGSAVAIVVGALWFIERTADVSLLPL